MTNTPTIPQLRTCLARHTPVPLSSVGHRRAAVLIPLMYRSGVVHLLLTKRTDRVEHHKGQISFPGGMADDGDADAAATALREAEEELGIPPSHIGILGTLDDILIPTGFVVTPIVGYIHTDTDLLISPEEVADVLFIPFEKFFDPSICRSEIRFLKGINRQVLVYDVWKEPVWGATAHMIKQLTDLVTTAA